MNNAREDRRLEIEAADRGRERRHAIRDHWREERKDAHAALLADLEAAAKELDRQLAGMGEPNGGVDEDLTERVREHFATAQILSLAETRVAAEQAFAAFVNADTEVWHFALLSGMSEAEDHNLRRTARAAVADLRKLTALYLDAVRIEIGTDEDGV